MWTRTNVPSDDADWHCHRLFYPQPLLHLRCGPESLLSSKHASLPTAQHPGFLQIQTCGLPTSRTPTPATLVVTVLNLHKIILVSLTSRSLHRQHPLCHPPKGPQGGPQDTHSNQLFQEGLVWQRQHVRQRKDPKANSGAREIYLQVYSTVSSTG